MDLRVASLTGCLIGAVMSQSALAADPSAPCQTIAFQNDPFTVCVFPTSADVRLFWGEGTQPYKTFDAVSRALQGKQERLVFGMNAGMYHKDRAPVGLYIDADGQRGRLQTKASYGNFGLVLGGVHVV